MFAEWSWDKMIDTIVCDKQAEQAAVALLGDGNVKEIEFVNEARAAEGSIYLGKITHLSLIHISEPTRH